MLGTLPNKETVMVFAHADGEENSHKPESEIYQCLLFQNHPMLNYGIRKSTF